VSDADDRGTRPDRGAKRRRWLRRLRLARKAGKAAAVAGTAVAAKRIISGRKPAREVDRPVPLPHERSAGRLIALLFLLATVAGIGLLVLYAAGGQVQLEGILLGVTLGSIGMGLILWGKHLFPHEIVTEEREPHPSDPRQLAATEELIEQSEEAVVRRTFLVRLLIAAAGALGLAFIFPIRSLGPSPGRTLFETRWRKDLRVVDQDGVPVRHDTLPDDGVLTVFPEGFTDALDSQAILVKVDPDLLRLPEGREDWAPKGNICYSKLCTHAGCPVGLYLASEHELQCPCHQSAFDVTNGAEVVFGPAARPLPQLELYVDGAGFLRANGDFSGPVGPGFWDRGDRP
jgi:ubiquinol-cytochrome c reductase iron-sulfur subunit